MNILTSVINPIVKSMRSKLRKHIYTSWGIFLCIMFSSCNMYDEEDVIIISVLKTNDLIEKKLLPVCDAEIEKLDKDIEEFNESVDMQNISNFLGLGFSTKIKNLDYDIDQINLMIEKYQTPENVYDLNKLEIDLTTELWTYVNLTYNNIIPAKAQNIHEGRYFTITELKQKYPDYDKVEISDFRPMELISTVDNEKIFDISLLSEGDINLRTLYIFYLHNRKEQEELKKLEDIVKSNPDIDYIGIIEGHCNEETLKKTNILEIINIFNKLSINNNPVYECNENGFKQFAFDYFETDMFRGEDID